MSKFVDRFYEKYTREQLEKAFDSVRDSEHWKNPIKKVLKLKGLDVALIKEAVIFFTSTSASFTSLPKNKVLVEADGYYMGPAGDR